MELKELQEEEEYFDLILKDLQEGEEGANLSLQDLQVEEVEADFILEYQEEELVVFILIQKFKHLEVEEEEDYLKEVVEVAVD